MFDDLCSRYPRFGKFAKALGRPLRVATMCSGTESPVLALAMMCKAVRHQTGVNLEMDHVFSCEIEPFKQAYIERNFQVWPLTRFNYLSFWQSLINAKKCGVNSNTLSRFLSVVFDGVLGPLRLT